MSDPEARMEKLIEARRCVQCEQRLGGSEQGALCSKCYFGIITEQSFADPLPATSIERSEITAFTSRA